MSFHIPVQQRHVQAARMKRQLAYEPSAVYEGGLIPDPVETGPAANNPEPSQAEPSVETPPAPTPSAEQSQPSDTPIASDSQTPTPQSSPASDTPASAPSSPSNPVVVVSQPSEAQTPTPVQDTVVLTTTLRRTSSTFSASATVSSTAEPSGGSKTGMIVGGIGAAAVAAVAVIFAIAFFIRRSRKRKDDGESPFDPHNFRRSAVLLDDDDPYKSTPPAMTENRVSSAPTFGTKYGAPPPAEYLERGPTYGFSGYDNGPYPSFQPGQYMASPVTATSSHGMMNQSPRMPDSPYDDQAQYLTRYPSVSERHLATPATVQDQPSSPSNISSAVPADDYVDLSRSSVSPFQAAQYAEISRQLNTEIPRGLDTLAATQVINSDKPALQTVGEEEEHNPQMPEPQAASPFGDDQELEFPAPPALGTRIDSTPPVLPEIHVRNGSYDFPSSVRGSSIDSNNPGNELAGTVPPYGQKFTLAPSPLANSTGFVPEPDTGSAKDFTPDPPIAPVQPSSEPITTQPKANETAPASKPVEEPKKRPDTVYSTIYDPNDAYGGI